MNNSFYGDITKQYVFQFEKIFKNRYEMDQSAASGDDGVFAGRFVLVQYDYQDSNTEEDILIKQRDILYGYSEPIENEEGKFNFFFNKGLDKKYFLYTYFENRTSDRPNVNEEDTELINNFYNSWNTYYKKVSSTSYVPFSSKLEFQNYSGNIFKKAHDEGVVPGQLIYKCSVTGELTNALYQCVLPEGKSSLDSNDFGQPAIWEVVSSEIEGTTPEGRYVINYNIDKAEYGGTDWEILGYDSTIWQKVYSTGTGKYVMVARLNTMPNLSVDIIPSAPTDEPAAAYIDKWSSTDRYTVVGMPSMWGFKVKELEPGAEKSDQSIQKDNETIPQDIYYNLYQNGRLKDYKNYHLSDTATKNEILLEKKPSGKYYVDQNGETTEAPDTYELSIHMPVIGNMVSDGYDLIYGYDNTEQDKPRYTNTYWYSGDTDDSVKMYGDDIDGLKQKGFESLAGSLNEFHDLLGQIVVELNESPDTLNNAENIVSSLNPDYLYKYNNKYYKKELRYDMVEVSNNEYVYEKITPKEPYQNWTYYSYADINSLEVSYIYNNQTQAPMDINIVPPTCYDAGNSGVVGVEDNAYYILPVSREDLNQQKELWVGCKKILESTFWEPTITKTFNGEIIYIDEELCKFIIYGLYNDFAIESDSDSFTYSDLLQFLSNECYGLRKNNFTANQLIETLKYLLKQANENNEIEIEEEDFLENGQFKKDSAGNIVKRGENSDILLLRTNRFYIKKITTIMYEAQPNLKYLKDGKYYEKTNEGYNKATNYNVGKAYYEINDSDISAISGNSFDEQAYVPGNFYTRETLDGNLSNYIVCNEKIPSDITKLFKIETQVPYELENKVYYYPDVFFYKDGTTNKYYLSSTYNESTVYYKQAINTNQNSVIISNNGEYYMAIPMNQEPVKADEDGILENLSNNRDYNDIYYKKENNFYHYSNLINEPYDENGYEPHTIARNYYYRTFAPLKGDKEIFIPYKYYVKEDNNYIITNTKPQNNEVVYELQTITNVSDNNFYVPNKYYYKEGNDYILDLYDRESGDKTHYLKHTLYVGEDSKNNCAVGFPIPDYLNYIPTSITKLYQQTNPHYQLIEITNVQNGENSIFGNILQLSRLINKEDISSRDLNTVKGALNSIKDTLFKLNALKPGSLVYINEFGQLVSSELTIEDLEDLKDLSNSSNKLLRALTKVTSVKLSHESIPTATADEIHGLGKKYYN